MRAASILARVAAAIAHTARRAATLSLLLAHGVAAAQPYEVVPSPALPPAIAAPSQPEPATGFLPRPAARGERMMAATADPHATRAALSTLERGGSAVDAAIAAQMVLTLVEPQSSGIGGGGFLLHYDATERRVRAYDGRETAPSAADAGLFLDPTGRPLRFIDAVVGGRAVGVPGLVRMLELAHRHHGRLPWRTLFDDAFALAREGFEIGPRLHSLLARDEYLKRDPQAAALYYDAQGVPWPVGHRLRNPQLAETLARIAEQGSAALHEGEIADEIVAKVRGHAANAGRLASIDLSAYRAVERSPLCTKWSRYRVCGMPPPSSGGYAVAQILGLLTHADFEGLYEASGAPRPAGAHRFAEASRLAFADRAQYLADDDFVAVPRALLADDYLKRRAELIGERALDHAEPGDPEQGRTPPRDRAGSSFEAPSTTQISIVDARGDAVSMTSSIETVFGARLMVRGFLLNNQLTDFSFAPGPDDALVANRVEPRKRPRSSMAPTLVFESVEADADSASARPQGPLKMVVGSPGGSLIIPYVAATLIATLHDGLALDAALALPHIANRNGPTEIERGRAPTALAQALRARGHRVSEIDMTSGLNAVLRECPPPMPGGLHACHWIGASDPRRDGLALGR